MASSKRKRMERLKKKNQIEWSSQMGMLFVEGGKWKQKLSADTTISDNNDKLATEMWSTQRNNNYKVIWTDAAAPFKAPTY